MYHSLSLQTYIFMQLIILITLASSPFSKIDFKWFDVLTLILIIIERIIIAQRSMDGKALLRIDDELAFIKNTKLFTLHIKPRILFELYEALPGREQQIGRFINRMEKDMITACSRSLHVTLKWLNFMHQLLQVNQNDTIIDRVIDILTKLPSPTVKDNFDAYINAKLLLPYKQYLCKLAAIFLSKTREDYSPRKYEETNENESIYCMYNLITFSLQEFSRTIKEFSRFFQRFFPCLNDYIFLIGKDLSKCMKRVRKSFEKGTLCSLTFLQVEQLESQLSIFNSNAHKFTDNWIFPETNAQSFQFLNEMDLNVPEDEEKRERNALQQITFSYNS